MTAPYDVVVVGAGPVGAACARELALAGRRVQLLEAGGEQGQAWRAAAGMLAPQIEAGPDDPLVELGVAAREHYQPLADALLETTGVDIGLWQEGIASVAVDEAHAAELRSTVAWQRQQGMVSDWLDAGEVQARWSWLRPTHGALWAPHEGALEPEKLVRALLADAQRLGVVLTHDRAIGLERRGDRVECVVGQRGRYPAGDIVLAAGAWSGLLDGLPRPLSVSPVRGQMVALPWPKGARRAIIYRRDCYVVARGDEAIAGSTMEYVGFRPEVTEEGRASIMGALSTMSSALDPAEIRRSWSGLRPVSAGWPSHPRAGTAPRRAVVCHRAWPQRNPAGGPVGTPGPPTPRWGAAGRGSHAVLA